MTRTQAFAISLVGTAAIACASYWGASAIFRDDSAAVKSYAPVSAEDMKVRDRQHFPCDEGQKADTCMMLVAYELSTPGNRNPRAIVKSGWHSCITGPFEIDDPKTGYQILWVPDGQSIPADCNKDDLK